MKQLTVLYDASCALCVRCRDFLAATPAFVPMELLACQSAEARDRFGAVPWLGEELVVASDEGDVWAGAAAFLVCLWALRDYREWSYRLSSPELAVLAERFFVALSAQRSRIASLLVASAGRRRESGQMFCRDGDQCQLTHAPRAMYR
jgi:predicted DCC family thiol-disulfide oxidoreductase YuxK